MDFVPKGIMKMTYFVVAMMVIWALVTIIAFTRKDK